MDAMTEVRPMRRTFYELTIEHANYKYLTYVHGLRELSIRSKTSNMLWLLMESPGVVFEHGLLCSKMRIGSKTEKAQRHILRQHVMLAQDLCTSAGLTARVGSVRGVGYVLCAMPVPHTQIAPA